MARADFASYAKAGVFLALAVVLGSAAQLAEAVREGPSDSALGGSNFAATSAMQQFEDMASWENGSGLLAGLAINSEVTSALAQGCQDLFGRKGDCETSIADWVRHTTERPCTAENISVQIDKQFFAGRCTKDSELIVKDLAETSPGFIEGKTILSLQSAHDEYGVAYGYVELIQKTKCSKPGNDLIKMATDMLQVAGCERVRLQDDSYLECGSLRVLYMLKPGRESWYESKGFKSPDPDYAESKKVLDISMTDLYDWLHCSQHAETNWGPEKSWGMDFKDVEERLKAYIDTPTNVGKSVSTWMSELNKNTSSDADACKTLNAVSRWFAQGLLKPKSLYPGAVLRSGCDDAKWKSFADNYGKHLETFGDRWRTFEKVIAKK